MRRYQITDLCVFALLLCLLEAASAWAFRFFPGEAYSLSLVLFFPLLMTVRWGVVGTAYAVLGGAVYCFVNDGTPLQYMVYVLGNACFAVNGWWLRYIGTDRIRTSTAYLALFCFAGYLSMCLGRAMVSWLTGQGFWLVRFLAVDVFNTLITFVLLLIARKQNGLLEPQRAYLLRLKREEEERRHDE